jgi:hypothetical protein
MLSLIIMAVGGCIFIGCFAIAMIFFNDNSDNSTDVSNDTTAEVQADDSGPTEQAELPPTKTPKPAAQDSGETASADTWLVMLYEDADDETLEKDMFIDLNEAEMVGSTDQVTIIAQMDRMVGGYRKDNFTTTKRFLIQRDDSGNLEKLASEELEDMGELDMGDKATLVDFATWAIQTYPAGHYALVLSDHGMGWPGGWSDSDPNPDSELSMAEIDEALAEIVSNTGVGQLDLIGFDACLMAQVESLSAVAPYARYAVASEETEPALGWAYASFLGALAENPAMDGRELAEKIVFGYIAEDGRILDDTARKSLSKELFRSSDATTKQVVSALGEDITLTAVDLSKMANLHQALNELVMALEDTKKSKVAKARSYTQTFTSVFDDKIPPSYIDLGHFAALLIDAFPNSAIESAGFNLQNALQDAIVAEKHGPDRPGATGFSIYFPDADLFGQTSTPDWLFYNEIVGRFAAASLWDDYLSYYYTGQAIDPNSADTSAVLPQASADGLAEAVESAPDKSAKIEAPGGGEITFNSLTTDKQELGVNDSLTVSADITGSNIAYIYIYTAYYDSEYDSYLTTDLDFIASDETKTVGGVNYPDWGSDDNLTIDVDWEPLVWTINDGENDVIAAAEAETYGIGSTDTFYRVWGTYKMADSEETHDAFLRFDAEGTLVGVFIFTGTDDSAAPREINPQPGDQFTVEEEWLEFDVNPDGEYAYYDGGTVTYGDAGFSMLANDGWTGDYSIGIIVEDMDGNWHEQYVDVTVK